MKKIADHESPLNSIPYISPEEYEKTEMLIDWAEAQSRITHQGMYIVDYYKNNFLYVSENALNLYGHTAQEVKDLGYDFYLKYVPKQGLAMLKEINAAKLVFWEQIPVHERKEYFLSYDFHLINGMKKMLVNHKFTPILLTGEGKVWLASCAVTPSTHTDSGHVIMYKTGEPVYWKYSLMSHRWEEQPKITLTEREKEILLLSRQGYTTKEIAEELNLGVNTVKSYRKELFLKLGVNSITEALLFVSNYKLL